LSSSAGPFRSAVTTATPVCQLLAAMSAQRPPANRMTLQTFKGRLGGAAKGFRLLKKKRDALKAKFQEILKQIVECKLEVGQSLKDASFSLAKSQWANAGDDIASTVVERAKRPSITTKLVNDNIAGVSIPVFRMQHDPALDANVQTMGIAHGGAVINACRETYFKAVTALVKLASLQTAFRTLDEEIKMTSRRVNALEYVLIPKIEDIIQYITQEMDEQSREEFFRVKKVVSKKKEKLEYERLEMEKAGAEVAGNTNAMDAPSALQGRDDDIVF
jgi:V-type H+-transporting ATPase subunit D